MIRICVSDDFTVDYDEERAIYRVSVLGICAKTMNEYWNEIWFDAYKDEAVRHGKWVKTSEFMPIYCCSECKERNLFGSNGNNVLSDHCPNCGARMERE